jgi:DNA modification methylase
MNQLILGDNLEVLRKIDNESVDLIYLDPPFFSNRNYEVIWGDEGEIRSFKDRWSGGVDHYIAWLKERVIEMHRILKTTGSIFLHCDWHANAYIRVFILDKIFGEQNFKNEIVWKRTSTHNDAKQGAKHFGRVCDNIFFYAKNNKKVKFNTLFDEYTKEYLANTYNKTDTDGRRFKASDLSAAKPGGDTFYEWKGTFPPKNRFWAYSKENMQKFEDENRIYYSNTGKPYLKHYLDEMPGVSVDEFWSNCVFKTKEERIGYPTQKPIALLERIIKCASEENDIVLDPFVGGGTTIAVADRLNRQWIGIDQSVQAVKVTEMRLQNQRNLFSKPFVVQLHKYDYDTLRNKQAFEFETWIIEQFGGTANIKQRNDLGLDGKTKENAPIQVKRSDNVGREIIDKFKSSCERYDKNLFENNKAMTKPCGFVIAFSFGKGAIQEVARLKNQENIIIQLVTVAEIVPIAKKPRLTVKFNDLGTDKKELREIEFIASAESESGIEFYAWDFNYNAEKGFTAEILLDKTGKQTNKFKAGSHSIAVKVIDNEGLENIEIINLKINGIIKLNE